MSVLLDIFVILVDFAQNVMNVKIVKTELDIRVAIVDLIVVKILRLFPYILVLAL